MKIRTEHFKNLVAVAAADGYLNIREREFLTDRAEELGLSEEELKDILAEADTLQYAVPLNMIEREDQLNDAVFMSIIDGHITDQEYKLCLNIADRLGIEKEYVERMIETIQAVWER